MPLALVPVMFNNLQQTVRIAITSDDVVEPTEMFRVRLSSTDTSAVSITGQDFAAVTITDSDSKCLIVVAAMLLLLSETVL